MVDPYAYVSANVMGYVTILEAARRLPQLEHLVYASSSSVYGGSTALPFAESDPVDCPVSLYAATKRADELTAHAYWHLYGMRLTGLRFFTVYGPWGRPDMAYFSFAEAIMAGRPITLYDDGNLKRDFTYVDDIVAAVVAMVEAPYSAPADAAPHRIYNLGNSRPEEVLTLIRIIEEATGKTAIIEHADGPAGDVNETYADITRAARDFGFHPAVSLAEGIPRFVDWFRTYRGI
jgi:UDP-glucuronate 4-epimerase